MINAPRLCNICFPFFFFPSWDDAYFSGALHASMQAWPNSPCWHGCCSLRIPVPRSHSCSPSAVCRYVCVCVYMCVYVCVCMSLNPYSPEALLLAKRCKQVCVCVFVWCSCLPSAVCRYMFVCIYMYVCVFKTSYSKRDMMCCHSTPEGIAELIKSEGLFILKDQGKFNPPKFGR
jgi:hypothetical protein